jgi:hypothetical protein
MVSPALGGLLIGFTLLLVASVSKKENWQLAYALLGVVFLFWSFGFFGFGRVVQSLIMPLTLLFGLITMYTKGSAQMLSMLVTLVLLFQIVM